MRLPEFIALAALLGLSGCAVGPDYRRPAQEVPAAFGEPGPWKLAAPKDSLPRNSWWSAFADPVLDSLEVQAGASSPTVLAALSRVDQAAALARVSRASLLPGVAAGMNTYRARFSANRELSPGSAKLGYATDSIDLPLALAYEVDLFGRLRRASESSRALAEAQAADYQAVLLSLQSLVAETYFSLRELVAEADLLARSAEVRRQALGLVRERRQVGAADEIDLRRAQAELDQVESDRLAAERKVADTRRSLAVLCGRMPEGFEVRASPLAGSPPAVPVGLPSELLERRPDVAAAERRLAAFNAQIGLAKAAFFPVIGLTAAAGYNSTAFASLFDSGSHEWSVAPFVSLPLFQGGRNRANYERSKAAYEEAVATYRGQVLLAFEDVEDGLSDLRTLGGQSALLEDAAANAGAAASLSVVRYQGGVADYFEVLDAQRTALGDELQAVQARGQRFLSTVLLIKALGGGW